MKTYTYCTREYLARWLAGPLSKLPSHEVVAATFTELEELAKMAFEARDPESIAHAEQLIYQINRAAGYAPPCQSIPGLIWTTLVQAKLEQELLEGPTSLSVSELDAALDQIQEEYGTVNHPLLEKLYNDPDPRALGIRLKNSFVPGDAFSSYITALLQRTPFPACRKVCLENFTDEIQGITHHGQREKLICEGFGLSFAPDAFLDDTDLVSEAFAMANSNVALCNLSNPAAGFGALSAIECNWHLECVTILANLRKRGMAEEVLEYLVDHAEIDVQHAAEWRAAILESAYTDEDRAMIAKGAIVANRSQWRIYDAMERSLYGG